MQALWRDMNNMYINYTSSSKKLAQGSPQNKNSEKIRSNYGEFYFLATCLTPPYKIITRLINFIFSGTNLYHLYRRVVNKLAANSELSGKFGENSGFKRMEGLDSSAGVSY